MSLPSSRSTVPGDRRYMSSPFGLYSSAGSVIPRSIAIHPDKEVYNSIGIQGQFQPAPNRRNSSQHLSSSNHHHRLSLSHPQNALPAALPTTPDYYNPPSDPDRESDLHPQPPFQPSADLVLPAAFHSNLNLLRSTLWWGQLEPWMDEEYAKQVCTLMGWDPVNVKVPNSCSDPSVQPTNNSGYCYLTFPSPTAAASVFNQINGGGNLHPITMLNSNKPFVLNWASSIPSGSITPPFPPTAVIVPTITPHQYPKEYSIFVGDLAPETSNSDLVAVFRNPVLGLRNDREPKFIRPFLSCKSAKIMLDPVTGISRGYGFVRFTEEADQQRALIEMHGLYCLSRPMRISPATAKFKPPPMAADLPQIQFPSSPTPDPRLNPFTVAIPLAASGPARSVSAPMATPTRAGSPSSASPGVPVGPSASASTLSGSSSVPSLGSESSTNISSGVLSSISSDEILGLPANVLALAQQYANAGSNTNAKGIVSSIPSGTTHDSQDHSVTPRYIVSEESWKHHAQARAILGNLIGPNGEQLTSTDPYNTTVFVGGLSPLISEDTLRTFFAPFGEIHYVKVPVGKHCGFVQFVRKADAEQAIEKMQGFPIGGSRIRLSWGRSQYKAAQAAAQAAQTAALQAQFQAQMTTAQSQVPQMTSEQAIQLLQRLGLTSAGQPGGNELPSRNYVDAAKGNVYSEDKLKSLIMNQPLSDSQLPYNVYPGASGSRPLSDLSSIENHNGSHMMSFSPFSPEPNLYTRRGSDSYDLLPRPTNRGSRFDSIMEFRAATATSSERPIPPSRTPSGSQRYGLFMDNIAKSFEPSRPVTRQEPISRPNSSETTSHGRSSQCDGQEEHDLIHDLNGTLASLDIDQHHLWKSVQGSDSHQHLSSC